MFEALFENVRRKSPLVLSVTNYVTANDCANLLLACGASPVMTDDPEDAAELAAACGGLHLNIGTLNRRTIPAMFAAGKRARELGRPVVLDPVGAGAARLRTETASGLLREVPADILRGNISEIKALASGGGGARGVDADAADQVTEDRLSEAAAFVKDFARRTGAVIAVTGAVDLVADGERVFCIRNGHPMLSAVTGAGCQLSALTAAFAAANPDRLLEAAAAAVCAMGLCGEIAAGRLTKEEGNASCRTRLIDAVYRLTPADLERGARYEVR